MMQEAQYKVADKCYKGKTASDQRFVEMDPQCLLAPGQTKVYTE